MEPALRASLLAGALAGLAGLAGFVAVHAAVVRLIPSMLLEGLVPALLAGAAAGYGYHQLAPVLPRGLPGGAAYGALVWAPAMLAAAAGALTGPLGLTPAGVAATLAVVALALGAAAGLGWRLRGPAGAKGLAAGALLGTLVVGGTILTLGLPGRPAVILAALLAIDVVAGLVLVALRSRLPAGAGAS